MRKHLAVVGLLSALVITGVTNLTLTSNDTTPVKGKALQLSCLTSEPFYDRRISWFNPQNLRLSYCYHRYESCFDSSIRYSVRADEKGSYAYINSLSQDLDTGLWGCVCDDQIATLEIKVYAIPSGLSITQNPDQDVDLSVNSAVLQCITVGCTYPLPTVKWIFKDHATLSETGYATDSAAGLQANCTSSEMIYTSTLKLARYTTFKDNSDKTGTFYCMIEYPDPSKNIISSSSHIVKFADVPDVIVNVSGSMLVGSNAVLMCTAQGKSQYTFHPWIHRVGQTEIRRLFGLNTDTISILTLSNISIQDMGTYICTVDNSITVQNGQLYQTGNTSLYVQGPPVIGETDLIFKGEIGKSASIKIPFYSNSSTTVKFIKHLGSFMMSNTSDVSAYIAPSIITLTFYTEKVTIPGHVAVLLYRNVTDRDFVHYKIQLSNEKGNVSMEFDYRAKDSIYTPSLVDSAPVGISFGGAVLICVGCFLLGCIVSIIPFTFRRQLLDTFFTPPELNNYPVGINVVAAAGICVVCVLIGCILALSSKS